MAGSLWPRHFLLALFTEVKCVEGVFSEVGLPIYGVLRSSLPARNGQVTPKITHMSDTPAPLTGVCCVRYVTSGGRVKERDRNLPSFQTRASYPSSYNCSHRAQQG